MLHLPPYRFGNPAAMAGFSLDPFMYRQENGLYYDFTKTDRHFQESTGPTPADGAGELIGLALDQRLWDGQTFAQVLAAASELFDFNAGSTTGWTALNSGTLSTVAGKLRITANGSVQFAGARKTFAATSGKTYKVTFDYSSTTAITYLNIDPSGGVAPTTYNQSSALSGTLTAYVVATGSSITVAPLANNINAVLDISAISCKLVPGIPAIQATGTLKPTWQLLGAKGDAADDNWLTSYLAGVGANFLGARNTSVAASLAATQIILGASGSGANRCFVGVDTSGHACGGVGSDSTTTIVGTTDLRGTVADIFLTFNGSTVRLIVNGVVEYEAAQNSTPTTSIPFRLFANNSNGTAGSFYAGYVPQFFVGREFISAATARNLGR